MSDDSPSPNSFDPVDWPQVIRQLRGALDCSQAELAAELRQAARNHEGRDAGVNANMVCKWETGEKHPSARYRRLIRRVAEKHNLSNRLRSPRGDMATATPSHGPDGWVNATDREPFNVHPPLTPYAPDTIAAIRRALLGYGPEGRLADDRVDPASIGPVLERRVQHVWRLRQNARYVELGEALPPLLADTDLAARESSDTTPLLVHAYNVTSAVLKKLGDTELASIASDRAIVTAKQLDDPLLLASAYYRLANVFLPAGRLVEAKEVALAAASLLEPRLESSSARLASWGGLLLTAALASARRGEWGEAWELAGEAKTASRRLGRDYADLHTIFGPTNLAIHGVQIAAELGDGKEALRRAERVNPDRLPPDLLERRSHFYIDLARGYGQQREGPAAVATLLKAEQLAPEEVRFNPMVRDLVGGLLTGERRRAYPELRELAGRVGALT